MKKTLFTGLVLLTGSFLYAQNKLTADGYAGIGTLTPRTMLEIKNHSTDPLMAPFITLHNNGTNTSPNMETFKLGGLMGSSYRDIRDPAYVSGVWFERKPAVNGLSSAGEIVFGTSSDPLRLNESFPFERMRITAEGKVGIGKNAPQSLLDVAGDIRSHRNTLMTGEEMNGLIGKAANITGAWNQTPEALAITYYKRDFVIGGWDAAANWKGASLFISATTGNVLINKTTQTNTNYKLDVNGSIRASRVVVNTTGADFVFADDYALPSLQELEGFIRQHHHLPEIPSAAEMQQEGLNVGDNQIKLLQKVEELTLYIIALNKQVQEQKQLINTQQERITQLEKK